MKFTAFLTIFFSLLQMQSVLAQNICNSVSYALYSDTVDAIHYDIHLSEINLTANTLKGYTEIQFRPRIGSLNSLKLELLSLTVDSVFSGPNRINGTTRSGSLLSVPLLTPADPTDTISVTVYYHGKPFVDPSGWGGFQFSGDYAFNLGVGFDAIPHNLGKTWFTCIDDFHDRALYDVYLRVPDSKKAISGGTLAEVISNGDNTSTWHWKTVHTLPTYLISASIGNYVLVKDTFSGISAEVPITFYCRPGDTSRVSGTFIHLKDILQLYEGHFGPYPFERVGYTATALGAMEHAANISYPYSGWNGNTSNEWWYAHELSHMWFGDEVTCASAEDMWLNEGWAVWCEMFSREGIYGITAARNYTRSKLKEVLQFTSVKDGGYYALYGIPQTLTYGNTVYEKGAQVVHTLRHYLGDSLFFGGIKAYLAHYGYGYASSCDLRDFLSSYTGVDLRDFFDAWVFSPGFPGFSIDHVLVEPTPNGYDASVFVRQKLRGTTGFANSNHLEITFMGAGWQQYTDTLVFSGKNGSKTFHLPFEPVATMADFHENISDASVKYTSVIKTTGETDFTDTFGKVITDRVTDSAMVRIIHNWVAPDSLKLSRPGLRISDARYWKVEGVFGNGFSARGKFFYSKSNYLDNTLLTGLSDSITILYRPDGLSDWRETGFTRQGTANIGYITVDTLLRGEYTLAVWNRSYGLIEPNKSDTDPLKIFPNPSDGDCTLLVDSPSSSRLGIYDSLGVKIAEIPFMAGKHQYHWHKNGAGNGIYCFRLFGQGGHEVASRKVVFE